MQASRRGLLSGGIATAALAGGPASLAWSQSGTPGVRPRVYGSERPEALADYKRAVTAMLALPTTDPRNWYRQALVHIMDCPHRNWWFLPWHRGYLRAFERICADLCGNPAFKLPYWDWTESASIPLAFFDDGLDSGREPFIQDGELLRALLTPGAEAWWQGLDAPRRTEMNRRGVTSPQSLLDTAAEHFDAGHGARAPTRLRPALEPRATRAVAPTAIEAALKPSEYGDFASGQSASHHQSRRGGLLESGPHDNVHGGTGGYMGAFLSPIDPLFWLHHANLDRLWDVWTRKQIRLGGSGLPATPDLAGFKAEPFLFFCDEAQNALAWTAGDCLSTNEFDYIYEPGSLEGLARSAFVRGAEPRSLISSNAGLFNSNLREGLESSALLRVQRTDFTEALESDDTEIVADITITPPRDPSALRVRVYINCPYLSQFTPVEDDHYVSTLTFFGELHHAGHETPTTLTVALGPTLRLLGASDRLPRSAIRVQLIPDGEGDEAALGASLDSVSIALR